MRGVDRLVPRLLMSPKTYWLRSVAKILLCSSGRSSPPIGLNFQKSPCPAAMTRGQKYQCRLCLSDTVEYKRVVEESEPRAHRRAPDGRVALHEERSGKRLQVGIKDAVLRCLRREPGRVWVRVPLAPEAEHAHLHKTDPRVVVVARAEAPHEVDDRLYERVVEVVRALPSAVLSVRVHA